MALVLGGSTTLAGPSTIPYDPTPVPPEAQAPLTIEEMTLPEPTNLDFAAGEVGGGAPGWGSTTSGYSTIIVEQGPKPGQRAVRLSPLGRNPRIAGGDFMQVLSASGRAGEVVEFTAMLRVQRPMGMPAGQALPSAQLFLRSERMNGAVGLFKNMADRPIIASEWTRHRLVGRVDVDCNRLFFGVVAVGGATVDIADVTFRVIPDVPSDMGNRPPAPLAGRGLENVKAWAELWGILRWFNPADESRGVAWDELLMAGIDRVEGAETPQELAARLLELARPVAPGVEVYVSSEPEPPAPAQPTGGEVKRVAGWRHIGMGATDPLNPGAMQIYRSERVTLDLDEATAGERIPKPGTLTIRPLPGGVTVRVPLTVFMDDRGTLPRGDSTLTPLTTMDRIDGWSESLEDRTVRLAAVIEIWNVIEHFYPYHSVVRPEWPSKLEPALQEAAEAPTLEAALTALRVLLAHARDGHGQVVHPDDPVRSLIPLAWRFVGDDLIITRVGDEVNRLPDFVKPGDRVIAIGNEPVASIVGRIAPMVSASNDRVRRLGVAQGIRTVFPTPQAAVVRIEREGDPARPVPFDVLANRVRAAQIPPSEAWLYDNREKRPRDGAELAPGVIYFDLDGKSRQDLMKHMEAFKAAKGLVFDMRGYPGDGAYVLMQHMAKDKPLNSPIWNLPIITLPNRPERLWQTMPSWEIPPLKPTLGKAADTPQKVAFITDGRAISYAESIMGIVEAYGLGEIVGEPTAGTNGNINPFRTPGGAIVYFTGMRVLKHNGSVHHTVGIRPTIPVEPTRAGITAGRDELLDAAVRAVSP